MKYTRTDLEKILSPDWLAILQDIADGAYSQGLPLYLVGGFVRDLYLGWAVKDFDLVVEGDAISLARAVISQHGGHMTVHARFGTAHWFPPTPDIHELDFISARSETYKHSAALPTVKSGMLIDDLRRRDFTINTLAMRLDGDHFGEVRNDLGGLEDLQAGLVRVLHPSSFLDDPTRLFRAVRYEQRYNFQITPGTLALIPAALSIIQKLSADRVRNEIDLILDEENAPAILKRLVELGILTATHQTLGWNQAIQTRFVNGMAGAQTLEHLPSRRMLGWTLWLMDVPRHGLENIEKRLHFDSGLQKMLLASSELYFKVNSLTEKKTSKSVAILDEFPLKAIQAVFLALPPGPARQVLHDYLETWRHIKPKTTGHTLMRRGIPQGPAYQYILRHIRDAWLDGEVKTVEEEMVLLGKLIKKYKK